MEGSVRRARAVSPSRGGDFWMFLSLHSVELEGFLCSSSWVVEGGIERLDSSGVEVGRMEMWLDDAFPPASSLLSNWGSSIFGLIDGYSEDVYAAKERGRLWDERDISIRR